jgi:hypothetical protein
MTWKTLTRPLALVMTLWAAGTVVGCSDGVPAPSSPVVSPDSAEGKKARAEDEALRALRRQQEAEAASRKRGLKLPADG